MAQSNDQIHNNPGQINDHVTLKDDTLFKGQLIPMTLS